MFVDCSFEDAIADDFGIGWGVCLDGYRRACGEVIDGVSGDDRTCRTVDINDNRIPGRSVDWNGIIKYLMYTGADIDGDQKRRSFKVVADNRGFALVEQ